MNKRYVFIVFSILIMISIGCATKATKPGTSGKMSSTKIENAKHPVVPDGVKCFVCHKEDIPNYDYHKKFSNNCDDCHDQNSWYAKKFPHNEWPLDKVHRARCNRCHPNALKHDFKTYQCWGCHHDETATKKTHKDLGIDDITECVQCHESSSGKK